MIKEIEMKNVKGQNAIQQLTGKDIIIGRNGAGKTTRMQTIGLAMLGYVPGKGKTAADTFKLSSGDDMGVRMETDSFGFDRIFTKTSKLKADGTTEVKISQKMSVSPSLGETTNTQKENRIRQELGDFPVMLDFGAFIAMTDNQQRDFIYNLSGSSSKWDRERVEKELRAALLDPEIQERKEELFECMQACIEETMRQYREGIDVQTGILAMSEYAKDKLKYWKKEKITVDGAAKKLTELKNRGQETDRDLAINQEKMKELQEKREAAIKEIAELSAKNKVLEDKEKELEKLQEEIANLENLPEAERIDELEKSIRFLSEKIAKIESLDPKYDQKKISLQDEMASLNEAIRVEHEKMQAMKEDLAIINAEIKANGDLLERISNSHGCCAFSQNIPCNQDFSEFIDQTHHIMDAAYEKKDEVESGISAAKDVIDELTEKRKSTDDERKNLEADVLSNIKSMEQLKAQMDANKTELSELQSREPVLTAKRIQEAENAAYLAENQKVDLTAIEDQKNLTTGQIESLQAKIDEQKKIRNDLMNIKANIIDSQTAEFNTLCWNRICNAIGQKGIRGCIVKEMLHPLLDDVNAKLHEIGIQEDFFFETNSDTGKEIFEFGWSEKPFSALSTGEQLLLMTALMTAMIEIANPPIKVLAIDNINDLDKHNLSIVMRGLNTIGKNMDNIILAGVVEPAEEDSEGWTIWRL